MPCNQKLIVCPMDLKHETAKMSTMTAKNGRLARDSAVVQSTNELRLSMSLGYLWLTTGIPVGKPMSMETHGSELLVITGLHGSGCFFWVLRVLATST